MTRERRRGTAVAERVRRAVATMFLLVLVVVGATVAYPESARTTFSLSDHPILGDERISLEAFAAYVRTAHPDVDPFYLATLYRHYRELCAAEDVSLTVALAQMIHETDFLLFSGSVRAVQYNYAGLGATGAAVPGVRFEDMRTGVAAHVQHLKAYASTESLATPLVDPRFHLVRRGSAASVLELTGRWATDPLYGAKLVAHISRLLLFEQHTTGDSKP